MQSTDEGCNGASYDSAVYNEAGSKSGNRINNAEKSYDDSNFNEYVDFWHEFHVSNEDVRRIETMEIDERDERNKCNERNKRNECNKYNERRADKANNEKVLLYISADSEYVVFLNGKFINCGQYDDFPENKVYDVLDLSDSLQYGRNAWEYPYIIREG